MNVACEHYNRDEHNSAEAARWRVLTESLNRGPQNVGDGMLTENRAMRSRCGLLFKLRSATL